MECNLKTGFARVTVFPQASLDNHNNSLLSITHNLLFLMINDNAPVLIYRGTSSVSGWMNGLMDGWMVGWMDGWMEGWMDG